MKNNKGFLQTLAALQILVFHLWVPITGSLVESFIIKTGYVGVDIFFLLSAYSLAGKDINYASLIKDRALRIYGRFAAFALLAFFVKHWTPSRLLKVLIFSEFFKRGGGSFLWFIPAIMIFYVLYPLFLKWNFKYKVPAVLIVWFAGSLVLSKCFGYKEVFIFTNRIGSVLAGYLLKTYPVKGDRNRTGLYVLLVICGYIAMYFWGFRYRLSVPFEDLYYIFSAAAAAGIAGLSGFVPRGKVWDLIGSASMEIYALQMIFGGQAAMKLYGLLGSRLAANIAVVIGVTAVSIIVSQIYTKLLKACSSRKANSQAA